MFLKQLKNKNPQFIQSVLKLYNKGLILPDTYCIDVDTLLDNAKKILDEANKYEIRLWYMLKQLGRNPYIAKKLEELGYMGAVLVDFKEVQMAMDNNLKLGNIGHLVQIPKNMLERCLEYGTENFTVYSIEAIEKIDEICKKLNKKQNIMLRIVDKKSEIYKGQEAGFNISELEKIAAKIKEFKNINLNGLTSFPCFLYSEKSGKVEKTENISSLFKAKELLEKKGFKIDNLNMPSATSIENMKDIHDFGANEAEPGHALSGTAPQCVKDESVEIPSYLYLSEISHNFNGKSYIYGGGYYPRSHLENALVDGKIVKVDKFNAENIDYYLSLSEKLDVYSPVIMCFRTQMFVTRSDIVLIEGVKEGLEKIVGVYTSQGIKKG